MGVGKLKLRQRIAERTAATMFALSLAFLVCQSILVVVWFDVPNFSENAILAIDPDNPQAVQMRARLSADPAGEQLPETTKLLMFAIWPIVVVESVFHWLTRPWNANTRKYHFFGLLFCISPSLRMCARSPEMHHRLWLPGLGWRTPNKRLRKRLERKFSVPMIMIAMMILPVLVIEFFMKTQVAEYAWLRLLLHLSTGVIWFAFAAEFILMVSVARKKIAYCKMHWIDLAIILLPFFSFLRSLRVVRAAQVTKMARVYRLRGTAVKALRALILLEFVQRIVHRDVDRSIAKLQRQLDEVEAEAKEIRRKIARLGRRRREQEASDEVEGVIESTARDQVST